MLEAIRQKKENLLYTLILVAIIFVMVFVYGSGKMSNTKGEGAVVAWVNGESISQREFQQVLQYRLMQYQQMLGAQYDEKLISAFRIPESTLEELIKYKLLAQEAAARGFLISDVELADRIRTLPYFQTNGKFDSEQYLKLPNRGLEENRMRKEMETQRWQNYLTSRVRLTPDQSRRATESAQTKIDLAYAKIDFNSLAPKTEPSAKEIEQFSQTASNEIKGYYDSHIKDFTEPAAVEIKKIRIGVPFQASETVKAEAKKKAQAIEKEVTPSNFEAMAKAKSDDEYAKKGGHAGWINRGTLEEPLELAIDKLKLGEISPLVETPFGYFLIKLENQRSAKVIPLEQKTSTIATTLLKEKRKSDWVSSQKKEIETLLAEGKSIEAKLKAWKVEIKKTGAFKFAEGNIPGIGAIDSILDGISDLSKSQPVSKKLFYAQDNYYYIKLNSFQLPSPSDIQKNEEAEGGKVLASFQRGLMESWQDNLKKKASIENELLSKSKPQVNTETTED